MEHDSLPTVGIPEKLKGFVYVVGMLGFPVIVAAYVLVVLSADMKGVEKELTNLSTRIAERPMGLERSTDFIVYIAQSLEHELLSGLPELIDKLDLSVTSGEKEHMARSLTLIKRDISNYIRPIVRKHQRFASRFPTVGGNLGSFFVLSAPGVDIEEGETEAPLRSTTSQKFSEALIVIILNNIEQFGNEGLFVSSDKIDPRMAQLFGISEEELKAIEENDESEPKSESTAKVLIAPDLYLHLTENSIKTAAIILRDQMLDKLKVNSTEIER